MKTHTIQLTSQNMPLITGEAHMERIPLSRNLEELSIDSIGPRIIILLGNSRKKVGAILTPGSDPEMSDEDIDRMELAIREPSLHMDTLFGAKGTIGLFRATKEKASETIGVRHTPEFLDAERRLDLLFQVHGIHLFGDRELQVATKNLGETVTREHKKSIHIWDEITHKLLQTSEGRRIFRQLRPIYLDRQRKREEAELSEFRSVDILFQRLLHVVKPTKIFIGTAEKGGRHEIYARHIAKIAGDSNALLAKPVQDIPGSSITVNLKTYTPIFLDFEV